MPVPRPSCRTCRYAVKAARSLGERAECRRYPPTYGDSVEGRFRVVDLAASPWCGEYQPRDTATPSHG
jgi:hypothetical protein